MRSTFISGFLAVSLLFCVNAEAQLTQYKDPAGTFRLTHPAEWKTGSPKGNARLSLLLPSGESKKSDAPIVQVTVINLGAGYEDISVRELASIEEKMVRSQSIQGVKIEVLKSSFKTINGREWWLLEYSLQNGKKNNRSAVYKTIFNKNAYELVYNAPEDEFAAFAGQVNEIPQSFLFGTDDLTASAGKTSSPVQGTPLRNPIIISPAVKMIDADKASPFVLGYAVIEKGMEQAVIDRQGEMILPWGYYSFNSSTIGYRSGEVPPTHFFSFYDLKQGKLGFITRSGQVVRTDLFQFDTYFNAEGKAIASGHPSQGNDRFIIDSTGKKIPFRKLAPDSTESMSWDIRDFRTPFPFRPATTKPGDKKFGYMDVVTGKFMIPQKFDTATKFDEGLAMIARRDQAGNMKWGIVDRKGNMIAEPQYASEPRPYSSGLSLLVPIDKTEFCAAFIDVKGGIKFRLETKEYGAAVVRSLSNGYTTFRGRNEESFVLDSTGTVYTIDAFLKKLNVPSDIPQLYIHEFANDRLYLMVNGHSDQLPGTMVVNVQTGKYQVFETRQIRGHEFDPESRLRYYTHYERSADGRRMEKIAEGYVNEDNQIVILTGKKVAR
ncbi:WG repeat-containing protein [Terrimonas sp. NA20]|uniref:WG repeat-containing protein n=1 Tax=Terrimonas ginsenosidimutans TaxID=2908004 RepID=A0ABS9KZY1_9BACT|nr:WG repeat-containing protein [Terrimonas ginsenosidimutans]